MSLEAWICIIWAVLSLAAFGYVWAACAINKKEQDHE